MEFVYERFSKTSKSISIVYSSGIHKWSTASTKSRAFVFGRNRIILTIVQPVYP